WKYISTFRRLYVGFTLSSKGNLSEIEKSLVELSSQQLQLIDLKKSLMEELCLIQDACNHPRVWEKVNISLFPKKDGNC
ncbi:unnamed protein product, partial [Prunus brigantina]